MVAVTGRDQSVNDTGESRVRPFEQTAREIERQADSFTAERMGGGAGDVAARLNTLPSNADFEAKRILPPFEVVQGRQRDRGQAQDDSRAQFFVATNGDDRNPGTADRPWQTIQKGARSATPGSVVNVMPGEYHGQVNVTVSGNERDGFITFRSAVPGKAVLDLKDERAVAGDPAGFRIDGKQFVEVSGFEIRNLRARATDATPNGVLVTGGSNQIRLNGLDIHHIENTVSSKGNAHGISVYGNGTTAATAARDIVIENNRLHDLKLGWSEALVINGNVENFRISNNSVYRVDNIGIDVAGFEGVSRGSLDQPRRGLITGNHVSDVDSKNNPAYKGERAAGGIYVDGGTTITISGNKVERANIGIELASEHKGRTTSNVQVTGNLIRNSTMAGIILGGSDRLSNGGSIDNVVQNNRFENNDTDKTGAGEIAFQNNAIRNTITGNTLITSGTFFSGSAAGNNVRDNQLSRVPLPDNRELLVGAREKGLINPDWQSQPSVRRDNMEQRFSERNVPERSDSCRIEAQPRAAGDALQNQAAILFDRNASAEDKLASVRRLSDAGLKNIVCADQEGRQHTFRLEKISVGSNGREMVHLFAVDQAGRERTVLRGIGDGNGNFERERNSRGQFVDFYGTGKEQLNFTPQGVEPGVRRESGRADRQVEPGRGSRIQGEDDRIPFDGRPADRRLRSNSSHQPMEPVTDPAILRDVGRRPNGRPVEPTYIGVDNSASYLGADGKKHIKAGVAAWLDKPAAQAFILMNEKLARVGKHIQIASGETSPDGAINSAGRTHTQQRIATGLHAAPGNSVHEQGRGLDVRNFADPDVRAALREFGFVQGNLSRPNVPIRGDAWHFSFDPKAEASVAQRFVQQFGDRSPATAIDTRPASDGQPRVTDERRMLSEDPRRQMDESRNFSVRGLVPTGPRHYQLKDAAHKVASNLGSVGYCARGVQHALNAIGLPEFMGCGNAWPMGKVLEQSGKFQRVPMSQAAEGDIIVRSWSQQVIAQNRGKNLGDIVVVTGRRGNQLMGANDHHGAIPPDGGRYTNSFALRLIG